MYKCPKCGSYMHAKIEKTYNGIMTIWECVCGYTTEQQTNSANSSVNISLSTTTNITGNYSLQK